MYRLILVNLKLIEFGQQMSGHSKWATIKRQKARTDAVRGKTFAQLSRAIIVAARNGADPAGNFQLRTAIDKAKAASIPNDNIERAIAKGAGNLAGEADRLEELRYEGYGPGGVALIMEALTDNRNRTAADLRAALSKRGGNLGETGCVSWMFAQKGVCLIAGQVDEDLLLAAALDGGADVYELLDDAETPGAEVFTDTTNLEQLSQTLQAQGFLVAESEWRWIPGNTVEITDLEQSKQLLKLLETLEALDDIQNVTANFEMSAELMNLALT
jgi:YebC/PmpR family DNA-binding regulatory protein